MQKDHKDILRGVIAAFWYNRDKEELLEVLEEVKQRLNNSENYAKPSEDGHIIASILFYIFGDYGTSPRYGWIYDNKLIDDFVEVLDSEIKDIKDIIEG